MAPSDKDQGHGKCGAKARSGQPCTRPAGWGTEHAGTGCCKMHGGSTPNHNAAAARELARQACVTLGVPIEEHPAQALLGEVFRTRGNVQFYEQLVQELPTHPDPDEYIKGDDTTDGHWERGQPGVYGRTYHVSGIATGEAKPHILVQLYNEERKHLVAATSAALKAGVDARRVQIEEDQALLIAEGFKAFAVALGHDPASEPVRKAFRAQLSVIAGGRAA